MNTNNNTQKKLSIVIPAYNEAGNIEIIYQEIERVMLNCFEGWEIIFVDDGSTDKTWLTIENICKKSEFVKGIRFSKNFGHQYALMAGIIKAKGDAVITMDCDLQHPPEFIPALISEWNKGSMIVKTIRENCRDIGFFKNLTSKIFYLIFSLLSGVALDSGKADFRLLDRLVVNELNRFKEQGLFLRGIIEWMGYPTTNLKYKCGERFSGVTKYNFTKMIRFAWHGITSFSLTPLRIGIIIGFTASLISFGGVGYAIYGKLIQGKVVPGWASSIAIVSFLFGALFLYLGILGEYIGRIVVEIRGRPRFIVSETKGFCEKAKVNVVCEKNAYLDKYKA